MKKLLKSCIIILMLFFVVEQVSAQKNCKVLKKEIAEHYKGKCKKGLANGRGTATGIDSYRGHFKKGYPEGKGTYTWANGDKYVGEWEKGLRNGKGTLYFHSGTKEKQMVGLWKNDRYVGPIPPKPKVVYSIGVDRYTFQKSSNAPHRVLIDIMQNGTQNRNLFDLVKESSSGSDTSVGNFFGYEFVEFPVTIKVIYYTYNKLHTQKIYVKFQFVISEPGDWRVTIFN